MSPASIYGLLVSALLLGALAASLLPRLPRSAALIATALAALPAWAGESAAMWVHGLLGAPSMTLAQLALLRCLGVAPPPLGHGLRRAFLLAASIFYGAFISGVAGADFYGFGYQPTGLLLLGVLPLAIWLQAGKNSGWLLLLGVDLLAYAAGLQDNLWNVLFDPVIVLLALAGLLRQHQRETASAIN